MRIISQKYYQMEKQSQQLKQKKASSQHIGKHSVNNSFSQENISSMPKVLNSKQEITNLTNNGSSRQNIEDIKEENINLKKRNKQLISQLQMFSKKLDEELKKRDYSTARKAKLNFKPEERQSIQIQNLYKKIDIYKKQINLLKSKFPEENQNKLNDYQNKIRLFMKQNQELRDQIKSLKKIIKQQEKGLNDIGSQGFIKITRQNQKLRQQLRKVRLQMDQVQRKYRVGSTNLQRIPSNSNNKLRYNNNEDKSKSYYTNGQQSKLQKYSSKNLIQKRRRMKTQADIIQKPQKMNEKQTQLNLNKYQQRLQKNQMKIKTLTAQKTRNREIIDNLKIQILQKDKQINYLKERIVSLRKIVRNKKYANRSPERHNQNHIKQQLDSSLDAIDQQPSMSQFNSKNSHYHHDESTPEKEYPEVIKSYEKILSNKRIQEDQFEKHELKTIENQKNAIKNRYPRFQQQGIKIQTSYKWNHFQFSSKIKQIQVQTNIEGNFITGLIIRYQKGQPSPININQDRKSKSQGIVCQQTQQFVHFITGGFKNNYLQYLIVKTNRKRIAEFGNVLDEQNCNNFVFNISSEQFPSALVGQNDNNGINRLGCFIQKLNPK